MQSLINKVQGLSKLLNIIAGIAITFMMFLTVTDVILRSFRRPIIGTYELVAFSGAIVIGFAVPLTTFLKGHVLVDFFVLKFPKGIRKTVHFNTSLLGIGLFSLLGWNRRARVSRRGLGADAGINVNRGGRNESCTSDNGDGGGAVGGGVEPGAGGRSVLRGLQWGRGEVTVNELVSSVNRALTQCSDDGICAMESCPAKLAQCQTDLASCQSQPGGQRFPASGQTTSYGPGSDGDVQAGATLSYTDNGDGTITDNNTGLVWEKKDDSGGIHDKDNTYTWGMFHRPYTMNGTMVTTFLATRSLVHAHHPAAHIGIYR